MAEHRDQILVRATPGFLTAVDEWRREQADLPSRAEALRRLATIAMEPQADYADRRAGRHRPAGLGMDVPTWLIEQLDKRAATHSKTREEMALAFLVLGMHNFGASAAAAMVDAKKRSEKKLDDDFARPKPKRTRRNRI